MNYWSLTLPPPLSQIDPQAPHRLMLGFRRPLCRPRARNRVPTRSCCLSGTLHILTDPFATALDRSQAPAMGHLARRPPRRLFRFCCPFTRCIASLPSCVTLLTLHRPQNLTQTLRTSLRSLSSSTRSQLTQAKEAVSKASERVSASSAVLERAGEGIKGSEEAVCPFGRAEPRTIS